MVKTVIAGTATSAKAKKTVAVISATASGWLISALISRLLVGKIFSIFRILGKNAGRMVTQVLPIW